MTFFAIVRQYERLVVFRLGRFTGTRQPGIRWLIPFVDRVEAESGPIGGDASHEFMVPWATCHRNIAVAWP